MTLNLLAGRLPGQCSRCGAKGIPLRGYPTYDMVCADTENCIDRAVVKRDAEIARLRAQLCSTQKRQAAGSNA